MAFEEDAPDLFEPRTTHYLRKFSKDTDAEALTRWFNRDVNKKLRKHKCYDPEGIFIGDGSYIFVPDNERYEFAVRMLFDEHGHPVDAEAQEKMTKAQLTRCRWRRCYKLVSLLHTDRARSFTLRVAVRVVPGNAHECPVLYELVDQFVEDMGEGLIQRLILDRGFIDGAAIERCKREHGIDVLIPVKKNMEIYQDVLGLLRLPEVKFTEYQEPQREALEAPRLPEAPPRIQQRERKRQRTIKAKKEAQPKPEEEEQSDRVVRTEVAGVSGLRTFRSCNLPVNVIVSREQYQSGREEIWMLLDTKPLTKEDNAQERRAEYSIRVEIEEGHRQLKCFWDLAKFTSVAFSMVLNQIIFVTLTFNLLQLFLKRERPKDGMPRRTRDRILDQLLPTRTVVVIYCENRFATMTQMDYTELLLELSEEAKQKVLQKVKRLRRSLPAEMLPARRL